MELILLEKIYNLGDLGQTIKVKPGFGRNYLIPQGKAIVANKENLQVFETRRAELEAKAKTLFNEAEALGKELSKVELNMEVQVGPQGKLYGSVTSHEVLNLINKHGFELSKKQLIMSQPIIRSIGEYPVSIQLHPDVIVELNLNVFDPTGEYTTADVTAEDSQSDLAYDAEEEVFTELAAESQEMALDVVEEELADDDKEKSA